MCGPCVDRSPLTEADHYLVQDSRVPFSTRSTNYLIIVRKRVTDSEALFSSELETSYLKSRPTPGPVRHSDVSTVRFNDVVDN